MIIFIWGKKEVFENVGYVADFCPLCREKQIFMLKKRGIASHVYDFKVGKMAQLGFSKQCLSCSALLEAKRDDYLNVSTEKLPLESLIATTQPQIYENYKARLNIESSIKSGNALSVEQRRFLIEEPFKLLYNHLENQFSKTNLDLIVLGAIVFGLLGMAIIGALGLKILTMLSIDINKHGDYVVIPSFALYIWFVWYQISIAKKRFFNNKLLPAMRRSLSNINPTAEEIYTAWKECIDSGKIYWSKIKPNWVIKSLSTEK